MDQLPATVRRTLRRLRRRLVLGVFLDLWPRWAAASLLVAGGIALVCRLWFPETLFSLLPLWLVPGFAAIPVIAMCFSRAYRPEQVAAIADHLNGGQGTLLSLLETRDSLWASSLAIRTFSCFPMRRLNWWARMV